MIDNKRYAVVQRRLLDLLDGWIQYLEECEEDARANPDEISEASAEDYQRELDRVNQIYRRLEQVEEVRVHHLNLALRQINDCVYEGCPI